MKTRSGDNDKARHISNDHRTMALAAKGFSYEKREHPAFFYHQSTIVFCPPFAMVPSAFL
jgi:hypothetical protein